MQAGVPVITSNVSSMPEIASDAALLCNPFDSESIAEQMKKLIHEPNLSESLISKGALRAKDFSWDKSAGLLWENIEKVAYNGKEYSVKKPLVFVIVSKVRSAFGLSLQLLYAHEGNSKRT